MTGEVRVWEARSRQLISHFKDHTGPVTGIAICNNDTSMITSSRDRSILRTDLKNERRQCTQTQRIGGINAITLSRDETKTLSVGQERRLTCWGKRSCDNIDIL